MDEDTEIHVQGDRSEIVLGAECFLLNVISEDPTTICIDADDPVTIFINLDEDALLYVWRV